MEVVSWLLLSFYGLTAISSGFNAHYFWRYRAARRGRRVAARTLALLHGALFLENAYVGGLSLVTGSPTAVLALGVWLLLRGLLAGASCLVTLLVLRQSLGR